VDEAERLYVDEWDEDFDELDRSRCSSRDEEEREEEDLDEWLCLEDELGLAVARKIRIILGA